MTPLADSARQTRILDGILDRVLASSRGGAKSVVVFDLDDTLFSTSQRHIRILREFCAAVPNRTRFADDIFRLVQLEPGQLQYSLVETAKAAGVADAGLLRELKEFWFERFFTNDYVRIDEPLPGAAGYCQDVLARGGTLVYMTGRDETMREGTLDSLESRGFPMPERADSILMLKPRFETPDLEYKKEALSRLIPLGEVAGGFENEPAHVELFQEVFPAARMVLVETRHSGKSGPPRADIPRIRNFERG